MTSSYSRPITVSANTPYVMPCDKCGGRGPHNGPGHEYMFPKVSSHALQVYVLSSKDEYLDEYRDEPLD